MNFCLCKLKLLFLFHHGVRNLNPYSPCSDLNGQSLFSLRLARSSEAIVQYISGRALDKQGIGIIIFLISQQQICHWKHLMRPFPRSGIFNKYP